MIFIKMKNFFPLKYTTNTKKKQVTDKEKIFATPVSNRGIVFNITKQFLQLSNNTQTAQLRNWPKSLTRHFTKGKI